MTLPRPLNTPSSSDRLSAPSQLANHRISISILMTRTHLPRVAICDTSDPKRLRIGLAAVLFRTHRQIDCFLAVALRIAFWLYSVFSPQVVSQRKEIAYRLQETAPVGQQSCSLGNGATVLRAVVARQLSSHRRISIWVSPRPSNTWVLSVSPARNMPLHRTTR